MSSGNLRNEIEETTRRDRFNREKDTGPSGIKQRFDSLSYKLFGEIYEERRDVFFTLQQWLKQSQRSISVEKYLARITLITLLVTGITLIFSLALATTVLSSAVAQPLTNLILLAILFTLFTGVLTGFLLYLKPQLDARKRRRDIDATLPYAVTFMYALSRGGMNMIEVMETLSESEATYGEMAREVKPIVKDIEYFSRDLPHALRRAARRSPSTKFEDFADDFVGILNSGADLTKYLEEQSEEFLTEARREQQKFIDTLELLGEVYVTVFVAGPLFLIIITVVMSMLGGTTSTQLDGIVYGLIPVLNLAFFILLDTISSDAGGMKATIDTDEEELTKEELQEEEELLEQDDRLKKVEEKRKERERADLIQNPIRTMLKQPEYTMLFTVPATLIFLIGALASGSVTPSYAGLLDTPVYTTAMLGVIPILIILIPYTIFYEWNAAIERRMLRRFPDALKRLASANAIGMSLTESLNNVADNTSGRLGDEFEKVRNDIEWKHDVNGALISMANRVRVPVVARTVKLVTEANQSTGDIEEVLEIAAKNVLTRQRLRRERNQALLMYTVVILISFFVYLFVIGLLDATFLAQIKQVSEEAARASANASSQAGPQSGGNTFQLENLPIDKYRMVFYHSAVIQAFGSGLLAGHLKDNDVRAGMKWVVILTIISTVAFALL